ncbi:hypothetical protein ACFZBU_19785 [Embleya sp. NPDC008237]|uniref:hypothetical protein n=1 Tax=Embleya sp. NPDC008237 TaxID=3363978 RepID=UPI0036E738DB
MESISVDLLSGLAAGAGGDAGRLAWTRLVELVRTPLPREPERPEGESDAIPPTSRSSRATGSSVPHRPAPLPTGELELTLLGHETPGGLRAYTRAYALAGALSLRADRDPDFARSIDRWYADARRIGMAGEEAGDGVPGGGSCCGGRGVIVHGEGGDGWEALGGPFQVGSWGHRPLPAVGESERDAQDDVGSPGDPGCPSGASGTSGPGDPGGPGNPAGPGSPGRLDGDAGDAGDVRDLGGLEDSGDLDDLGEPGRDSGGRDR